MKCNEIQDLLSLYIDGELDERQAKAVADHLSGCPECDCEYKELSEMVALLREVEEVPFPEAYEVKWNDFRKAKRKFNWRVMSSVAAVFIVGILSFGLYQDVIGNLPNQEKPVGAAGLNDQTQANRNSEADLPNQKEAGSLKGASKTQQEALLENQSGSGEGSDSAYATSDKYKRYGSSVKNQVVTESVDSGQSAADSNESVQVAAGSGGSDYDSLQDEIAVSEDVAPVEPSRCLSASSVKSMESNTAEAAAGVVPPPGAERNSAAVGFYSTLIAERLKEFDYQITESKYVNGDWHFSVFIFHGKDGNTYNEDIMIIGRDGGIELCYTNEFMGLQ